MGGEAEDGFGGQGSVEFAGAEDGGMEGLLMAMATGYDYRKYQKVKALEKKGSKQ